MKTFRYISIVLSFLFFLFINFPSLNAASILRKVTVNTSAGIQTYHLVTNNKMTYEDETLIKIPGGMLKTDREAVIEALDKADPITFRIEKGEIYFRFFPA